MLKLPANRLQALIVTGEGLPFDAGKGRPMKEWVALADGVDAPWQELGHEALGFVGRRD